MNRKDIEPVFYMSTTMWKEMFKIVEIETVIWNQKAQKFEPAHKKYLKAVEAQKTKRS